MANCFASFGGGLNTYSFSANLGREDNSGLSKSKPFELLGIQ